MLSAVVLRLSGCISSPNAILPQRGMVSACIMGDSTAPLDISLVEILAKSLLLTSSVSSVYDIPTTLHFADTCPEGRQHTVVFSQLCSALQTAYMVKYKSLDRKLRKIVKNKYRYFRFYSMIKPASRIRAGLRFILLGLAIRSNQKFNDRLDEILWDVIMHPSRSVLLSLKQKHQMVSLSSLALSL